MKVVGAVLSVVLLHFAGCSDVPYQVPEPLFHVFFPRGLEVSVPDSRNVTSVEFFITLPRKPDALTHVANHPNHGYWIYWNPDVVVNLHDKLYYKLMIRHSEVYWKKEGSHVVEKVLPLSDRPDGVICQEHQGQEIISEYPKLEDEKEEFNSMLAKGKANSFKSSSSFSVHKTSGMKPITKSSTSTTSGTFYIKPSGVMEATGHKSGSTFDSSKREGEQWEHYQSALTAEELENMRRLYGSEFYGFPHLNDKVFPNTAKIYEKSYMSSESKSFPGEFHKIAYGEEPMTTHQFHQTHKTHESTSHGLSRPASFQLHWNKDSAGSGSSFSSNRNSEQKFWGEPLTQLPNPLPPQGTIVKTTEYVRKEHTVPAAEASQVYVERGSHTGSSPQKILQVSQTGEYSSHNQKIVKPVFNQKLSHSERGDQMEYNTGNLQTIERQDYSNRHYLGNIFTSVKTTKVKTPQECTLVPGLDYRPEGNLEQMEKFMYELSCLATLMESTVKEEIALLKQKNAEYVRKMGQIEHEIKRLGSQCNCYE